MSKRKAEDQGEDLELEGRDPHQIRATRDRRLAGKKKRVVRETPLSKFRKQTIAKRLQLKKVRKDCDRELRAIERDLGILKRNGKKKL